MGSDHKLCASQPPRLPRGTPSAARGRRMQGAQDRAGHLGKGTSWVLATHSGEMGPRSHLVTGREHPHSEDWRSLSGRTRRDPQFSSSEPARAPRTATGRGTRSSPAGCAWCPRLLAPRPEPFREPRFRAQFLYLHIKKEEVLPKPCTDWIWAPGGRVRGSGMSLPAATFIPA